MRNVLLQAVLVLSMLTATAAQAVNADQSELERMFIWWNAAMARPDGFTAEGFRQHFTEDAVIAINGEERVKGIEAMVRHFKRIQANTDSVEIVVPFFEKFREGDKLFTYHKSRAVVDGRLEEDLVMGYVVLRDGKIARVNFLNHQPWRQ